MFKKSLIICGAAAALVYIVAVIYGGANWDGYSHIRQAISELTMSSAPNQTILRPLFYLFAALLVLYSMSFILYKKENKWLILSGWMLFICGLASPFMLWFPMDLIGAKISSGGSIHLISAAIASVSTILAVFFAAPGVVSLGYRFIRPVTISAGLLIVISGVGAALAPTYLPNYLGLFERITIGIFLAWLVLLSMLRYVREENFLVTKN